MQYNHKRQKLQEIYLTNLHIFLSYKHVYLQIFQIYISQKIKNFYCFERTHHTT
jgi:hypothetical protein